MTRYCYYYLDGPDMQGGVDLGEFIEANDFDAVTIAELWAMEPGESITQGGGAAPTWTITRLVPRRVEEVR